ncbi:MAG: cell division protein DivIVA [Ignavibacteria bacterium RBG_16_34_14]|nr:MAG: cell division protein DivIVA [Ignavibacteria bacterium RBG_16_34_14]
MKLSPQDIKRQEFKKSLRGFDKEEVQAFLEKLADDIDELLKENESLKKELETVNENLAEYRKLQKNIQDTLAKAQESSSRSIESAKKQANLIIQEAELKAGQILEKAREGANDVRNAVIQLREEKLAIISKLKAVINSQAHLLEMKVENALKEDEPAKTIEKSSKIKIDVDDIADKL